MTFRMLLPFVLLMAASIPVLAHCDGMDGPVVKAAEKALELEDVNLVLIWVHQQDEPEIRQAFNRTLAVRKLGSEARELADLYFFETLVRVHRAGEGAPYTGLKPAGRDLGPAIPAADRAIDNGSISPLLKLLQEAVSSGTEERFQEALSRKEYNSADLTAGREYAKAYVEFIHYVERMYQAATTAAEGHYTESKDSR